MGDLNYIEKREVKYFLNILSSEEYSPVENFFFKIECPPKGLKYFLL